LINIKPFKAIRPKNEFSKLIASEPYDVLTLEEVKNKTNKNPLSFLKIIRPESDFDENTNPYADHVYKKAKENYDFLIKNDYIKQDPKECFYVYKQKIGTYEQTGLIAAVSVFDYENGLVKEHEKTRIDKENDRIRHIETLNAQTGFVFLTYKSRLSLNDIINKITQENPEVGFKTEDGINHFLWIVDNSRLIKNIIDEFIDIDCLYIADGHHRSAAAVAVAKKRNNKDINAQVNYFLSIIYPHDNLRILSYNRVVKDLNNLNYDEFLKKIEKNFVIEKISLKEGEEYSPDKPKTIGMYLKNSWYLLKIKESVIKDINDPVLNLDVSILQEFILDKILGIINPRTDERIEFISGARGSGYLMKMVDSKKFMVAFYMYPTSIKELMNVADADRLMPPKSTWFDPKPLSGLIIHDLE